MIKMLEDNAFEVSEPVLDKEKTTEIYQVFELIYMWDTNKEKEVLVETFPKELIGNSDVKKIKRMGVLECKVNGNNYDRIDNKVEEDGRFRFIYALNK